jgi:hypothetical protein
MATRAALPPPIKQRAVRHVFFKGEINMNFKVKNKTPKTQIISKTADVLKEILGGVVLEHVITDIAEQVYKAIKKDIKPSPDLINYHEVVKLIKDMKFPDDQTKGPEQADHNYLLDKVHKRLKEKKALSKKEE